jgi:hyperosmotically inducible periplasmic protein
MRTQSRYLPLILGTLMLIVQPLLAQDATKLKSRVITELGRYYDTPFKIMVDKPGVVTITGTVQSYWDKLNVFTIVSRVPDVREISNLLAVNTDLVADDVIKANIANALQLNNVILEPEKIQVVVDHGLVILRGTVSFRREAEGAEDIAAWQSGVKSVENQMTVLPPKQAISDENLLAILQETIDRFFPFEKSTVKVQVNQGQVTLTGNTTSLWARQQIEKEVRRVQGVREVDNKITVVRAS